MEKVVHSETPIEYFRELVDKAIARQKLSSSEHSAYYLVQLLSKFVRGDRVFADLSLEQNPPLAELLCEALGSTGRRRLALFKLTGDLSLFISGFFSDSLNRKLVDLDYYVRMGGYAYGRAAGLSDFRATGDIFLELSRKFVRFVDVLNDVSESSAISDNQGVLRLYEKWLKSGSTRAAEMLRMEGVLLGAGSKSIH